MVSYEYDAWGKNLSVSGSLADTVGQDNPFRYRGYYYDNESGFYYLQSRYYDAGVRRFINADTPEILGLSIFLNVALDTNIYVYCSNNPINDSDGNGFASAKSIAKLFSVYTIMGMFMAMLYANY